MIAAVNKIKDFFYGQSSLFTFWFSKCYGFFPRTVVDIMIYVVNVERHLQK